MDQATAIQTVKELLPSMRETRDPSGTLLKYAQTKNLAVAQLEKLGHVFNTLKSITFFDKHPDNRGGFFELLDVPDMTSKFASFKPDTKSKTKTEIDWTDSDGWLLPETSKAASTRFPSYAELNAEEETEKQAFTLPEEPYDYNAEFEVIRQIEDDYRDQFEKAATAIENKLREGMISLATLEEDALHKYGSDIKPVFERMVNRLELTPGPWITRLDRDPRNTKMARDRTGLMNQFEKVKEALEVFDGSTKYAVGVLNYLTGMQPTQAQTSGMQQEDLGTIGTPYMTEEESKPWSDVFGKSWESQRKSMEASSKSKKTIPGSPMDTKDFWQTAFGEDGINKSRKFQKEMDETIDDDTAMVTLAELTLRDPILSKKDPEMVVNLFNTLRTANPQIAADPNLTRLVLREAIEYGALPIHTIKDLVEIDYNRPRTKKTKDDGEDEPKKPKK